MPGNPQNFKSNQLIKIKMKLTHHLSLSLALLVISSTAISQDLIQYPAASLELKINGEGGKNGASVAYNPEAKLYYAVIAGNAQYPLETFAGNGYRVNEAEAYSDMRGLWWNSKAGTLEGNCYGEGGIVSIGLTGQGYAGTGNMEIFSGGGCQPTEQSVGTFDPKKKEILYYTEGSVVGYSRKDGTMTSTFILLYLPADEIDINWTTLIFTGVKGMEFGLLDYYSKKVYLFSRKDGYHSGTVNLPADAMTYETFNVSYANGYVFLFDQDLRKWTGYKIFEF
jgi:hypothetical protein